MTNITASPMDRRAFLALGLGACCAVGLTACGQSSSKGTYDDGYSAGYAAGLADAEAKAKQEEEEKKASIPTSGVEYAINSASLGTVGGYSTDPVIILELTGKNVGDTDNGIYFNGREITAYQGGKALMSCTYVEGRDSCYGTTVQAGISLDGWVAYRLIDTETPVECKAGNSGSDTNYYGLTNPQTIDLSTL